MTKNGAMKNGVVQIDAPLPKSCNELAELGDLMEVSKCAPTEFMRNNSTVIHLVIKENNKFRQRERRGRDLLDLTLEYGNPLDTQNNSNLSRI